MQRRRMIARASVFLLLIVGGAIVNVAVAWGCALWLPFPPFQGLTGLGGAWPCNVPSEWPDRAEAIWQGTSAGITVRLMNVATPDRMTGMTHAHVMTGWPWRSLQMDFLSECFMRNPKQIVQRIGSFDGGAALKLAVFTHPRMPYRGLSYSPIWSAFAINTLFYAAVLWLLFAAPFALRRWRRIRRGLCPACAYPLGESDLCTECGKPVMPRPSCRILS